MVAVIALSLQWLCLGVLAGSQSAESAVWLRLWDPGGGLAMAQSADFVVAQSAGVAVALFVSLASSVGGVCNWWLLRRINMPLAPPILWGKRPLPQY